MIAQQKILSERYQLVQPVQPSGADNPSESWIGLDDYDNEYLIKLWPFHFGEANDLQRALWDSELRTMYRVSSSPGAEETLLTIREAGLDNEHKCFVMVMQAQGSAGYQTIGETLRTRSNYPWLSNANIDARRQLWLGLQQIAKGIQLLHSQAVLHRNVSVENVFLHPDRGPASFRLGGFEWSVRVGEIFSPAPPVGWSLGWTLPPELSSPTAFGYRPENDWYGFGMLAIRCLLNVEAHRERTPSERYKRIIEAIDKASERQLSQLEKTLLQRLITRSRPDRLMRGYEIMIALDDVIESLRSAQAAPTAAPLILAYNPTTNHALIEAVQEVGFIPNPRDPQEPFHPNDVNHCMRLSAFIQQDLAESQLYLASDDYILIGNQLSLKITRLERRNRQSGEKTYSWDGAFCIDVWALRWNEGGTAWRDLPPGVVTVRTMSEIRNDSTILGGAQSWERHLPSVDKGAKLRASLSQFHDFVRCTNQIELLMRDAELFQYEVIERTVKSQVETLKIKEIERSGTRGVMDWLRPEGGMMQFLQREIESNKENCRLVVLDTEDSLRFPRGTVIEPRHCFQVMSFELDKDILVVSRISTGDNVNPAPDKGWLRTFGMFGQIDLVRRRKEAIDRLANHAYLLRSIYAPGQVFMDTGDARLPWHLPVERVDEAKQAVMKDVLRTRPIYALQGPPGTGKTTMVAHLLRQIFHHDSVAQVLITAQAHGAVDVLRAKVRHEAFRDVEEAKQPLAIRIGRNNTEDGAQEGSVEAVAEQILTHAIQALSKVVTLNKIQQEWCEHAKEMLATIKSRQPQQNATEFLELVKRGANITYCTTSAGDLEELARGTQSFDWTIIEEAGKCHGFDLALPLQAGHRWLLIGDDEQLPPYRLAEYSRALVELGTVVENLKTLPYRAAGLLDQEWIHRWESLTDKEQSDFKDFARIWLTTFSRILSNCRAAPAGSTYIKETRDTSIGAAAGMLSLQYRMHPTIGTLISEVYYDNKLQNKTVREDGQPETRVVLPVLQPEAIRGLGIVWLDTPSASKSELAREIGPIDGKPRYTNPYEVDAIRAFLTQLKLDPSFLANLPSQPTEDSLLKIAILSPYNQQVSLIRNRLADLQLPEGIVPKEALRTRQSNIVNLRPRLAHTVDSFQGNEADIILVSLVRNNRGRSEFSRPLGFLEDPARMNVLLSRAQRLLVLVGSWEFFAEQVEPYLLEDISREQWHLRKVMTLLQDWFASSKALKLDAADFVEVRS